MSCSKWGEHSSRLFLHTGLRVLQRPSTPSKDALTVAGFCQVALVEINLWSLCVFYVRTGDLFVNRGGSGMWATEGGLRGVLA